MKKCFYCDNLGYFNKEYEKVVCIKHCAQLKRHGKVLKRTRFDKNEIIINNKENHAKIKIYDINNNFKCYMIIDIEDVDLVSKYKWSSKNRYARAHYGNTTIALHRLIINAPDNLYVDHIDRNTLNNKKSNLRLCTKTENNRNVSVKKHSKSQIRGVYKDKYNKFVAYINVNKKKIHLGYTKTKEEAIKLRQESELKYFGEFSPFLSDKKGDNAND
jgi:hypothetical protein